jgi:uncharacterized small protein (DUF1192 family)
MSVYNAPSFSFIDAFSQAAKYSDDKTDARKKDWMEGFGAGIKGGVDAYKWQQRKNVLEDNKNKMKELDAREAAILAEIEQLKTGRDYKGSKRNFDAIMAGIDWNQLNKYPTENGGLF